MVAVESNFTKIRELVFENGIAITIVITGSVVGGYSLSPVQMQMSE